MIKTKNLGYRNAHLFVVSVRFSVATTQSTNMQDIVQNLKTNQFYFVKSNLALDFKPVKVLQSS